MERRRLGSSDLEVAPITLGGMVYGWTLSEADTFRQLDRALEAGLNFIDTADMYSRWVPGNTGGDSEAILGRWFAKSGKRKDVVLATKVGVAFDEEKIVLQAEHIERAVEASLRRLQTDYIDLYQAHADDKATPLEETLEAFDKLVKTGKLRFIGASNYAGSRLAEAMEISKTHKFASYVSLQPHYNLVHRQDFESDLLPAVKKYNLGVIPYFALGAGFLTGKYRSKEDVQSAARHKSVGAYLNDHGLKVVSALEEVARRIEATPARVALAWLIIQPGVTSAIASATKDEHLDELIEATRLKLDAADIKMLNDVSMPVSA